MDLNLKLISFGFFLFGLMFSEKSGLFDWTTSETLKLVDLCGNLAKFIFIVEMRFEPS